MFSVIYYKNAAKSGPLLFPLPEHFRYCMAKKHTTKSATPETLTDFIEEFARRFSGSEQLICYRGQRDASWSTVAGIFRPEHTILLEHEETAVRRMISVQPHEFASDETMFEKLVRMQHFGLPTRLLDVSRNALVALFFATGPGSISSEASDGVVTAFGIPKEIEKHYDSDTVSCIANLANMNSEEKDEIYRLIERRLRVTESLREDISSAANIRKFNKNGVVERLLQFIRAEKPYFQPIMNPIDLFVPYYVHPKLSNRRILAQSGAFILYGLDPPKNRFFPYKIEETTFVVPQGQKSSIRAALKNIGIEESTLFPEIDRAAAQIKNEYKTKQDVDCNTQPTKAVVQI